MSLPPFDPIDPEIRETMKDLSSLDSDNVDREKVNKIIQSVLKDEKRRKRNFRMQYLKSKWIEILTLLVAVATLIVTLSK